MACKRSILNSLAVFTLLLLPFGAFSQDDNRTFTLKPSLGLNACQVHGDSYSGYNKAGLFAGIAVNAYVNDNFSLELGFYFSQKGARHNQDPKNGDYTFYRLNLNYLDLPLSMRYKINKRFFVTLGPSVAYLVSYKEDINNIDMTQFSHFNRMEIGLNIGLGCALKKGFSVEVRSGNSINAIRNYGQAANLVYYNNPVARFFNKGFYNNILSVFVSYTLGHNKQGND